MNTASTATVRSHLLQQSGERSQRQSVPDVTSGMVIRFEAGRRLIRIDNTARAEYEPKVILSIEGYATDTGTRDARLMRNQEPVNLDTLILGQLRVLAGLSRRTSGKT